MANSQVTITRVTFDIEPELTHCTIWFWGTDNSILDTGAVTKTFPASMSVVDIMNAMRGSDDFLLWPRGIYHKPNQKEV